MKPQTEVLEAAQRLRGEMAAAAVVLREEVAKVGAAEVQHVANTLGQHLATRATAFQGHGSRTRAQAAGADAVEGAAAGGGAGAAASSSGSAHHKARVANKASSNRRKTGRHA